MAIESVVKSELRSCDGECFSIGKSVCGNPILCTHKGSYDGKQIIVIGGIHARECYTATVVLEQARRFKGGKRCGAYFIPLLNPDGAAFFERGQTFSKDLLIANLYRRCEWKANANGVDLNTNFDANWGGGACNALNPSSSDFIGNYPHCECESSALVRLTKTVKPIMTVSYHAMGGELYWEFDQSSTAKSRDEEIAKAVAEYIGVKKVDGHLFSAGGYKDYCISKLKIPAITIELVKSGKHPLPVDAYLQDVKDNAELIDFLFNLLH